MPRHFHQVADRYRMRCPRVIWQCSLIPSVVPHQIEEHGASAYAVVRPICCKRAKKNMVGPSVNTKSLTDRGMQIWNVYICAQEHRAWPSTIQVSVGTLVRASARPTARGMESGTVPDGLPFNL